LQIGNWVETRQNCLVLSPIVFTPQTQTRQFCLVRVGGVNKLLENTKIVFVFSWGVYDAILDPLIGGRRDVAKCLPTSFVLKSKKIM